MLRILLAFVAGVGVGLLLAYDPPQPKRSARPQSESARYIPQRQPERRAPPEAPATTNTNPEERQVVFAEDPNEVPEGSQGTLEIDFGDSPVQPGHLVVKGTNILGEIEDISPDELVGDVERYILWPVEYTVEWYHEGKQQLRVRVEAGAVTHLRMADPQGDRGIPVPPDKGRLDIRVFGLDGLPLGDAFVLVHGRGAYTIESEAIETDARGRADCDLRPGAYRIQLGSRIEAATLVAGKRTMLEIRYGSEGELIVDCPLPGYPRLAPVGGVPPISRIGAATRSARLLYVRPGTWDLYYDASGETLMRRLGRVRIEAGRVTRFAPTLPTGGLRVRLPCIGAPPLQGWATVNLKRLDVEGDPPEIYRPIPIRKDDTGVPTWPAAITIRHLPPGLWEASGYAVGYTWDKVRISVTDKMVDLTLRLEKQ